MPHKRQIHEAKYFHFFSILVFCYHYSVGGSEKEDSGKPILTCPLLFVCCLFVSQAPIQVPSSFAWHTQTSVSLASRVRQSCPCSGPAPIPRQHPPCQERSQSGTWEKRPREGPSESCQWALTKEQSTFSEGRRSRHWRRDTCWSRGSPWWEWTGLDRMWVPCSPFSLALLLISSPTPLTGDLEILLRG